MVFRRKSGVIIVIVLELLNSIRFEFTFCVEKNVDGRRKSFLGDCLLIKVLVLTFRKGLKKTFIFGDFETLSVRIYSYPVGGI